MTIKYDITPSDEAERSDVVPYYTPKQPVPAGTIYQEDDKAEVPKLFQPIQVGNLRLHNRIGVSPMCMYSADDKLEATPFHLIHYGSIVSRGPGITIVESAAVSHDGGLSPHDLGIWTDAQAEKLKPIVDFAHSQSQLIAIQINHGGRKASGQPLFVHLEQIADKSVGGWPDDVVAPSSIAFRPHGNYKVPHELTKKDIDRIVNDFGDAAKRAVEISGFDAIEIHGAHGYLINEFYSPISNKRTDEYGGSFENRTRFLVEVIDNIKSKIPSTVPVFLRISAVENSPDPEAWTIEDSKKLADLVITKGISLLDISSGGNDYRQPPRSGLSKSTDGPKEPIHVPLARAIKQHVGDKVVVATVGGLHEDPALINKYIEKGDFDLALVGRGFLRNPGLVWEFADKLGVRSHQSLQYGWGWWPNRQQVIDLIERTSKLQV
ncbi:NADH-dependent flavin oxidoreductase [Spathaspora passalidarum NRRL Y-27907]|uniref:NADH-dependent flavin oxidoreductase n=1 Tax=Spathaspora passalidarum (strain NRRL Y-27907 / 11-Y1) TaxID=619300 RepID=G3AGF5_SPAPN|nr:NADH-dependent flavin oxidoreductase [Spathaspora passalidarum NRRL Y-27907]EGW35294.1 NADH-dependent flavin oxidoreductase [Spathaspora passalidarum NRRL Y-27907]